jgi:alkanesulfonate monooxygenase SsuD/methylene tetrahydromethanopterin reductase-like flavin-dependent oxidoreductase (luciferase family)
MKIFTELTYFGGTATAEELRDQVRRLEDAGSSGVSIWDHIFTGDRRPVCDPLTLLAAVAAVSPTLEVQTIVMNASWLHPALLLRQFTQLAVLLGGDRVTAGLGAGWSYEEWEAMGIEYPSAGERVSRLADVLEIASQLYGENHEANHEGKYYQARKLPLNPVPATPPQILVGAAGDRMVGLGAKYADKVDFIGLPKDPSARVHKKMQDQHNEGAGRRGRMVVADLVDRVQLLKDLTEQAGRPRDAVKVGVQVNYAVLCRNQAEVAEADRRICAEWFHIPEQSLANNPYTLRGEPQEIADTIEEWRERLDVSQITIQENQDSVEFCQAVVPLLSK